MKRIVQISILIMTCIFANAERYNEADMIPSARPFFLEDKEAFETTFFQRTKEPYHENVAVFDEGCWGNIDLKIGSTKTLYSQYPIPYSYKLKSIYWKSKHANVEIVRDDGESCVIKGSGTEGISGIKVFCLMEYGSGSYSAYYTVHLIKTWVSSVTLNYTSETMKPGDTKQLVATILPEDATDKTVNWSSSNDNIVTVNANGLITAISPGNAVITCKAADGYNAKCNVTVESLGKIKLFVSHETNEVEKGTVVTLSSKYGVTSGKMTEYHDLLSDIYYTLDGTNPSKESTKYNSAGIIINENCTLKAIAYKDGYETSDVLTAEYTTIDVEPTKISLPASKTIKVGESYTMDYTLIPSNAMTTLTWTSFDTSIATVSTSGVVEGIKSGYTYVQVETANGISAYCKVVVEDVEPTSISLPTSKTIKVGGGYRLEYTLTPSNAVTTVTWSSDDPSIVLVSSTGVIKGKKAGYTYVNAKTSNGKMAYCKVTVEGNSIAIDKANFPDDGFRNYLLRQDYGKDGILTMTEINNTRCIKLSGGHVKSLKGIEFFPYLDSLICKGNELEQLDIAKNDNLSVLDCGYNQLASLDISKNEKLKTLNCSSNPITTLVVKYGVLTSLDASSCTSLQKLDCSYNNLTHLNIEGCKSLKSLYCNNNNITSLVLPNTLSYLHCSHNRISDLDLSKCKDLFSFDCDENLLTSLDVSNNQKLTQLDCGHNSLTSLDVSNCTHLDQLYCWDNLLTSLDVSNNTEMRELICNDNELTTIIMSDNMGLWQLDFHNNQLASFRLPKNPGLLGWIWCSGNPFKQAAMDILIESLPQEGGYICVFDTTIDDEYNVCSKTQLDSIIAKGWKPVCWDGTDWFEYEVNDNETAISNPVKDNFLKDGAYYDLQGRRVPNPTNKGIYINKGKKIVVR